MGIALTAAGGAAQAAATSTGPAADRCTPDPNVTVYVRAERVDRLGRSSGSYVDSRCPGRMLGAALRSPYHLLRHAGRAEPGAVMTVNVVDPATGARIHQGTATAGRSGSFRSTVDLRRIMAPGDALSVNVHHQPPGPSIQQDLIEYALLAGFISG
jgi:hypothetical protein